MSKRPFLMNFKQKIPCVDADNALDDPKYSDELQLSVCPSGELLWRARSQRRPTSCSTSAHRIKSGYPSSGKWKPSRVVPSRTDKRVGR
jgi:hypothetical protein